tara:strand:+ start:5689 stop:6243 length:555 start_codon:yes stop_codon:yes gene_type:complete
MRKSLGSRVQVNRVGPKSKGEQASRIVLNTTRKTLKSGKVSKGQMRTAIVISQALKGADYTMEVTWDWLSSEKHILMYADIFFPKYNLVVEYHGEQHFKFPNFFHKTYKDFFAAQQRDKLKKQLILNHNLKFIEWHYNEPINENNAYKKLIGAGINQKEIRLPAPTRRAKRTRLVTNVFPRRKK